MAEGLICQFPSEIDDARGCDDPVSSRLLAFMQQIQIAREGQLQAVFRAQVLLSMRYILCRGRVEVPVEVSGGDCLRPLVWCGVLVWDFFHVAPVIFRDVSAIGTGFALRHGEARGRGAEQSPSRAETSPSKQQRSAHERSSKHAWHAAHFCLLAAHRGSRDESHVLQRALGVN